MYPRLMQLVDVTIAPMLIASTEVDEDYGEPIQGKAFGPPQVIRAQPNLQDEAHQLTAQSPTVTGNAPRTMGHLVMRNDGQQLRPKEGDRIDDIAGEPCNAVVKRVTPQSPYKGRFRLLFVELRENREEIVA